MPISMQLLPDQYTVHRLAPDAALPSMPREEPWWTVLRSRTELSLCCRSALAVAAQRCEPGWRVLRVDGPLDFSLTGIAAALTVPLAAAEISVFLVSSFDTDYLLVRQSSLQDALAALRSADISVTMENTDA